MRFFEAVVELGEWSAAIGAEAKAMARYSVCWWVIERHWGGVTTEDRIVHTCDTHIEARNRAIDLTKPLDKDAKVGYYVAAAIMFFRRNEVSQETFAVPVED